MGINLIAALWGFAEATLFVLVPDILLSALSLSRLRTGLVACLWTLAGALMGGAVMYIWGFKNLPGALAVLEALPGISPELLERVHQNLAEHGLVEIFLAPLFGVPYKILAVQAPAAGISLGAFLFISIPARLVRFASVTALAWWIFGRLPSRWSHRRKLALLFVCWLIFYAFYFSVMPG